MQHLRPASSLAQDALAPAGLVPTPDALRRLIGLRYVIVGLLVIAVLVNRYAFGMAMPWAIVVAGIASLLLVNSVVHWRVRQRLPLSERQLFANFVLEVLALTAVLYVVGRSSTSPLVSLYLLPVVMAANLLRRGHIWLLTLLTAGCYALLLVLDVPGAPHSHDTPALHLDPHVLGHGAIFLVSAALVAHYVASLAQSLRERDRQLALAREEALRSERIVALGTLGAGAAHELGTPLATMSVLAEDMARRHRDAELAADVADLQAEIARCKRILNALAQAAGTARGEGGGKEAADRFVGRAVERWRRMRPGARAVLRWEGPHPAPDLVADQTLEQALFNLLDNAADASPSGIAVAGRVDGGNALIEILDEGPGLSDEAQARAGELFFSTKAAEGGMGIGLFLANATIERFGGSVRLLNRDGGGCCTRVALPLLAAAPVEGTR